MTIIVRFYVELKQTDLNLWYVKTMGVKTGLRINFFRKPDVSNSIPIDLFFAMTFDGITLTLRKSLVHCSGVMQW